MPATRTRHKGILRLDYPEKHLVGYRTTVGWRGKRYDKFFSDTTYGDRLSSLDAAIQWRNQRERELGKPRTERLVYSSMNRGRPGTGVLGVRRITINHTSYYQAQWLGPTGERKTRKFSVTKYGEREARRLAILARRQGERERWNSPFERPARRPRRVAETPPMPFP